MTISSRSLAAAVATVLIAATAATPAQAAEKEWNIEVMPYLWASGIKGDASIGGEDIEIDASFTDLMEMMEIGGGLLMRAERSQWVLWTQVDYMAMNTDKLDDSPDGVRLDSNSTLLTGGFGRNFGGSESKRSVDVLLGVRYLELDNKLRIDTLGTFKAKTDFTDPVLILRPSFRLSERWRLNPTFSYGNGGDSESTYELQPQIQFQMTERAALRFGYRKLHYKIENSSNGNGFDGSFEGALIGVSGTFGGEPEPVAAPPPPPPPVTKPAPPPPPPPPPPGDADKDGVTDDRDRCPNTAAGIQVDAIGCFKEVTLRGLLFETNSAELSAEAKTQLDTAATNFKALPADVAAGVSVTVEGHTDNTGSEAYNQGLSQRRADAGRQHLIDAGLPASIITAKGMGEGSPVDTNDTAEGRHNNRRVVIRATR
jgi:outer membrane protein OmpA-like peptidoglycan-associated protein